LLLLGLQLAAAACLAWRGDAMPRQGSGTVASGGAIQDAQRQSGAVPTVAPDTVPADAEDPADLGGKRAQATAVPAVAPASVPASVNDTANIVTDVRSPLPFSRDVVVVRFKTGASQAARSAAIQRVSGIVIGGLRGEASDGGYIIRLPPDPTNDRVFDALSVLEADTAVSSVSVYWFLIGGASYLPPRDSSASGWHW
jgi:hypothetical protein